MLLKDTQKRCEVSGMEVTSNGVIGVVPDIKGSPPGAVVDTEDSPPHCLSDALSAASAKRDPLVAKIECIEAKKENGGKEAGVIRKWLEGR